MAAVSGVYNRVRSSVTTSTAITIQQVTTVAATMIETVRAWTNQSTITTSSQTRVQLLRKSSAANWASKPC